MRSTACLRADGTLVISTHHPTAAAGFVIERLIEPTPDPAMEHAHPEVFEKLSREPAFILFKLRKLHRS